MTGTFGKRLNKDTAPASDPVPEPAKEPTPPSPSKTEAPAVPETHEATPETPEVPQEGSVSPFPELPSMPSGPQLPEIKHPCVSKLANSLSYEVYAQRDITVRPHQTTFLLELQGIEGDFVFIPSGNKGIQPQYCPSLLPITIRYESGDSYVSWKKNDLLGLLMYINQ